MGAVLLHVLGEHLGQELLAAGKVKATDTASEHWGRAPLHMAAIRGNHLTGRLLVEHGAAVDARDEHQSTALHAAAQAGSARIIAALHGHPGAVGAFRIAAACISRDDNNRTPLGVAVGAAIETLRGFDVTA